MRALDHSPESPELLFARAELRLHAGDAGGWFDYESRPTRLHLVSHLDEYPEWSDESLVGCTLLVMREQGFGDEIMFARFLSQLRAEAKRVVVFTYPDMARVMTEIVGTENVITSESDIPDSDYWIASGSLPQHYGGIGPLAKPLFKPSSNGLAASRITSQRLRVGLRWAGNARHARDRFRSFDFEALRPLLDIPGCDFYSLQDGEPAAQSDLPNIPAYCHDVADLAEAINALDVVITCDTMVGHLAGSLGKKTFVLLDKWPDWRWSLQPYASVKPLFNRDRWIYTLRQELAFEAANVAGHPYVESPPKIGEADTPYGKMRHLNNDKYIGRSLALYGEYSPGEHEILRAILKPGDVVVEAGANIGALSVVIADANANPGAIDPGSLYCVRAAKGILRLSAASICRNSLPGLSYRAICAALGSEYGEIEIPGVETETVSAPSWENKTSLRAAIQTTVDSLDLSRLNLLKVDVDGPEHDILLGAEQTIDRCRPVIFVEYDKIDKYPDMLAWINSKGYRIYKTEPAMWRPDNFAKNPVNVLGNLVSIMLLCIPTERHDLRTDTLGIAGLQRVRVKK